MPNILLVDDEDLAREGISKILRSSDFQVIEAHDDTEALNVIATKSVDLVISEVVMPNSDGIDFVIKLRQSFPTLPILSISGGNRYYCARFGLDAALLSGANDGLAKPFTAQQLLKKVTSLLAAP